MKHPHPHTKIVKNLVTQCLQEDLGTGDLTAALTSANSQVNGTIISRETGVICGIEWVNQVFKILEREQKSSIDIKWLVADGDNVAPAQTLCRFAGAAQPILAGERSALNILQTLSGTATITRQYADAIAHTSARLLDTRKTLPMLREAQKYAVLCGGGLNHRMGLYDGIIIKENHLRSDTNNDQRIEDIVQNALNSVPKGTLVELEVENLSQLKRGLAAGAKRIMLDNFSLDDMRAAVKLTDQQAALEASGNVNLDTIVAIAETGVDFISSGAITKNVTALDLSMLFD